MPVTLLTAALVVTPADVVHDGAVLVENERIVDVGPRDQVIAPRGARRHDLPDATLLPGLIDAHVHVAFIPGTSPPAAAFPEGYDTDHDLDTRLAEHARALLVAGVTTARDLGDRGHRVLRLRDAIARHEVPGPRLLVAGTPLTTPGGHCSYLGGQVKNDDDIRAHIAAQDDAGADWIKVMVSGGETTPGGAAMWESQFDRARIELIVSEAHIRGLPVAVHAHNLTGITDAVAAGVDTIEHCTWLAGPGDFAPDPDVAADMAARGTIVCPGSPLNWQARAQQLGEDRANQLIGRARWLHDRGVTILPGTDAGLAPFDATHDMLAGLTRWGWSTREILDLATSGAADALELTATTGRLSPGLAADILAVRGNPLEDLRDLSRVALVMARGHALGAGEATP